MTYAYAIAVIATSVVCLAEKPWKPVESKLTTPWTAMVTPDNVWPEYPRPQMERKDWMNLNGLWDFTIAAKDAAQPAAYDRKILVPFPVEAPLSGIGKLVEPKDRIWYRRMFTVPKEWVGKRVLLNFEAVDWDMTARVNGKEVGSHQGGYDPFSFDITDALKLSGDQELVVSVLDPSAEGFQPVGKQSMNPGGCFYTRSSGIWQPVWLEPVAQTYIKSFKITPDIDGGVLRLAVEASAAGATIEATALDNGKPVASITGTAGAELQIKIPNAKWWSPVEPFLYELVISITADGKKQDEVKSYFGMRKIAVAADGNGIMRMMFNNKFLFQIGPLDQGFWPDGLHAPPCEEAIKYDLEMLKKCGFNMLRKHIKVEPRRYYYWCDKLGLLVWQDMPALTPREVAEESKKIYARELERMIATHYNVPSIIMWVPFNEAWGQHDTEKTVEFIRGLDKSRLINNASGWVDKGVGDVVDAHYYPGPPAPRPTATRAAVVGEYGGLGYNIPQHMWAGEGWGYATFESATALNRRYEELAVALAKLIRIPGISAAVYTQTSDIEMENNGLMTYDRKVIKIDPEVSAPAMQGWFAPEPVGNADRFIDQIAVELKCAADGAEIRYTLDGSEPTPTSPKYAAPVVIKQASTLKARAFYPGNGKSRIVSYDYKKIAPKKAVQLAEVKPGLFLAYYETAGDLRAIPDFKTLKPSNTYVATGICLERVSKSENFALAFDGWFLAPETGVYTFYCSADNGGRVQIAGETVVDNDGVHGMQMRYGSIALEKGLHHIAVGYYQGNGDRGLRIECEGPGMTRGDIPASALFHKKLAPVECLAPAMVGPTPKFVGETAITLACIYKDAKIHFTIDGSEPSTSSPLYSASVKITKATMVKARAYADDMTPSPVTTIAYEPMTPVNAATVADAKPGLSAAFFELAATPEKMPDFDKMKPAKTIVAEGFNTEAFGRPENFAVKYDGFITVPADGVYIFRLAADDEARLMVAGQTVVEKAHFSDDYSAKSPRIGFVALKAGQHPFSLLYYQGYGGRRLVLEVEGPVIGRSRVEGALLTHSAPKD